MTVVSEVHNAVVVPESQSQEKADTSKKDGDSIFACAARKAGMDGLADFLRDDWTAKMARKAGNDKLANWIEGKDENGNDKECGFFENIARTAVKHPVLTIAAMALSIYGGRQLYKKLAGNTQTVAAESAQTIAQPVAPVTPVTPVVPESVATLSIESIPNDIESVNRIIEEGLEYERSIHFRNLEIFQNATDKERELMLTYFRSTNKEKELLLFASGNKPALLEGIPHLNDDVFDALRSDSVSVAEFFTNSEGNLIINNKEVGKIINENLPFFRQRLGLSETTTADEIFKCIKKSYANCLKNNSQYADLRALLLGYTKYDAYHAQLVQDLRHVAKDNFYQIYRGDIGTYKETLKRLILDEKLTYGNMSPEFKTDLIKKIESLSTSAFRNFLNESIHVFPNAEYDRQQLEALRDLALKLRRAQTEGAMIGF